MQTELTHTPDSSPSPSPVASSASTSLTTAQQAALQQLDDAAAQTEAEAGAPNTIRTHEAQWRVWHRWCQAYGVESGPPARPQDVRRFLRWRADNRLDRRGAVVAEPSSLSTIETAASAIAAVHRRQGLRSPITEAVREQLRALRKARLGAQTRQARGLRPADLALVRLAFDALLRRSEVAAVRWKDVSPEDDGSGRLRVVRAKTGVVQESVYLGPPTMTALDAIRPAEPDNDALVFGLYPDTIGRRLKRVCERAGLGEGWSGHSMRVGAAQSMVASAGATLPELMTAGGWKRPEQPGHYIARTAAGDGPMARLYARGEV